MFQLEVSNHSSCPFTWHQFWMKPKVWPVGPWIVYMCWPFICTDTVWSLNISNSDSCLVLLPVELFSHNFIHPISWNILSVFWLGLINTLKPSTIIRISYPEVLSNTAIPHLVSSHSLWWYECVKEPYGKRQLQISILSSKTRKLRWTLLITVT